MAQLPVRQEKRHSCLFQRQRVVANIVLPFLFAGEQCRVVQRDWHPSLPDSQSAGQPEQQPLPPVRSDSRPDAGIEQCQPVDQLGTLRCCHGGQLSPPTHRQKNDGADRGFAIPPTSDLGQHLGDVIDQPAVVKNVAALLLIQPRAPPVQKAHRVASLAQPAAGVFVPPRMTLDAVQRHDITLRFAFARTPESIVVTITIRRDELSDLGVHCAAVPTRPSIPERVRTHRTPPHRKAQSVPVPARHVGSDNRVTHATIPRPPGRSDNRRHQR